MSQPPHEIPVPTETDLSGETMYKPLTDFELPLSLWVDGVFERCRPETRDKVKFAFRKMLFNAYERAVEDILGHLRPSEPKDDPLSRAWEAL